MELVVVTPPTVTAAPSQTARRQNAAIGKLKYERVEGKTTPTHVYATYPLKFLHPRGTVRQGYDTFITVSRSLANLECYRGMDGYDFSPVWPMWYSTHCELFTWQR